MRFGHCGLIQLTVFMKYGRFFDPAFLENLFSVNFDFAQA